MPRDGSGNYTRTNGNFLGATLWAQQAAAAPLISSPQHDTHDQDIAQALTDSVAKDGQTPLTGNLNMGSNRIVSLADGAAATDGAALQQVGGTLQTPQSVSGTEIDFSVSAWIKRITFQFVGVSTNGSDDYVVRLGGSGGFETSGYSGTVANLTTSSSVATLSAGFNLVSGPSAVSVAHGQLILSLENAANNTWVATGMLGFSNTGLVSFVGGSKSLSEALTQARLTTSGGTDTFDAGEINILVE